MTTRSATLALVVLLAAAPFAQQPAFEVASIRVNTIGGGAKGKGGVRTPQGTSWSARNATVHMLIRFAYGVTDNDPSTPLTLEEYQVVGGPEWIRREAFDIDARMPEGPTMPGGSALMLQRLLAERFALKVHTERREEPAYALLRAEEASGLRRVDTCEPPCRVRPGFDGLTGNGASMTSLAIALTPIAGRPVVDHTGLTGVFDFQLRFAADPTRESKFPSIFTAIQEQLGLKLESTRAPIEVVVVDHVERPSEN